MTATGTIPTDAVDLEDLGPNCADMSERQRESYGRTPLRLTHLEDDAERPRRPFPTVQIMQGPPPKPPKCSSAGGPWMPTSLFSLVRVGMQKVVAAHDRGVRCD